MSLAVRMSLRSGDVVVVPITLLNVTAHFVVYWGMDANGEHWYLENNHKLGVRWLREYDFMRHNATIKRVERFQGDEFERNAAIVRATSLVGSKYHLEKFNCEHYTTYVQKGIINSKQVDKSKGLVTGGVVAVAVIAVFVGLFGK